VTPCSTYCRPDENIHVWVDYARDEEELAVLREEFVGWEIVSFADEVCIPPGTDVFCLSVEAPIEAPATRGVPFLVTVRMP